MLYLTGKQILNVEQDHGYKIEGKHIVQAGKNPMEKKKKQW